MRRVFQSRKRLLGALAGTMLAACAIGAVAYADTISADGDVLKSSNRLAYGSNAFQEPCANRGAPAAGAVTVKFNGTVHYDPGTLVTVSAVPQAISAAAGITSSGGSAFVPAVWNTSGQTFSIPISTTVPASVPDGSYSVDVTATGSAHNGHGQLVTLTGSDVYVVTVDCGGGGGNIAPSVQWNAHPFSATAGSTKTYTFGITDPDSSSWAFDAGYPDCGTGTLLSSSIDNSGKGGSFDCQFTSSGSTSVSTRITDGAALSNVLGQGVTVGTGGPGPLAAIAISPQTSTIDAGGSQAYTAEGFDASDASRGDVTGDTSFTISPNGGTTGASCTGASCTATQAGDYTVTGNDGGFTDTATLHVVPAALASITISPDTASIQAGGSQPYTAEGFDSYGNSRGDVTGSTTFTIAPNGGSTGASCGGASCTATQAGGYTVTGTDGAFSDTAALTVTAGPLASITISPDTASISAGGSQPYTAEGFDTYGNSRGDVTGDTSFTISPNGGTTGASCTGASCTATQAGDYTVTGNDGGFTDTATLHVVPAALASITISPDTASIQAGGSQPYTAEGFDSYGNSRGDVTGSTTFTIAPNGGSTGASCGGASCTATQAGGYTVTGTDGAFSDTAALTVTAGPLASITISPDTATIASGGGRAYTAEGFDGFHNSLGDVTGATTFTIAPNGGTTGASCTGATCTAARAGSYTVTGTDGAFSDTATLTVPISAFDSSSTVSPNSTANPIALAYAPASATVQSVTQGTSGGTVAIDGTGHGVTYTPLVDFVGTDTFTYTVTDGAGHTATAKVTVNVQTSGSLADAMVLEDGTFHPLNGFDIHFAKSKLGPSYLSAENTDPGEMHLNVDLVNHTGVDINTSKGNRVVAIFTVPDMPSGCGLTAVDCAVTAGDLGRPAFKLDAAHEIKVHPDDKTDLMPVSLLYKATGACSDPGGYTPTFPANRAPKCIKISGFAIPRNHKAHVDIDFRFRTGSNWPAASNPQQNFVAGFNFGLTKLLTYGFGTPSAVTYSTSDNLVTVGTGKSATAVGGFLFDTSGNPVGSPYHVRIWKQSAGASCSAGTPAADVTPNDDGFYYSSLADGTAYFVQVCKGPTQVASRTLAKKLEKNKLDEEDFSGLPPSP